MSSLIKISITIGILIMTLAGTALAQVDVGSLNFASTPNPVGSGGRAVAWGGAFIAVADDATAASWNPAGLIQLSNPEVSLVFSDAYRTETQEFKHFKTNLERRVAAHANVNYASGAIPFHIGDFNFVASLNYQRLYEFDRKMDFTMSGQVPRLIGDEFFDQSVKFEQVGALTTVSPAIAVQITPAFSIGMTMNFWGLDPNADGWEKQVQSKGKGTIPDAGAILYHWAESKETFTINGFKADTNMNPVIGLMYKTGRFSVAAVYKHWFRMGMDYDRTIETAQFSPTDPNLISNPFSEKNHERVEIHWPSAYGMGFGYRYSDALSFAIDAYITEWSNYELRDSHGNKFNLISGTLQKGGEYVSNTMQFHAGGEYLWVRPQTVIAFRGGFLYDPEPTVLENDHYRIMNLVYAGDKHYTLDFSPRTFYGIAFGTGVGYKSIVVDAAIQYRWANGIEGENVRGDKAKSDVEDWFLIISLIYYI